MDTEFFEQVIRKVDRKQLSMLSTAVLTVATAWWVRRAIRKSKEFKKLGAKEIPTPEGQYFYLGHLPLLGKYPGLKVTEWHNQLGPIFQIKAGVQNWVFIGDPEAAHEIFVSKGTISSGRPYLTYGNGIHGEGHRGVAFIDNNKNWKNARTATLNMLSPKSIDNLHEVIERQTREGVQLMIHDCLLSSEAGVNPVDYTRLSAINFILSTVFGLPSLSSSSDPLYKDIVHTMEYHIQQISVVGDISAYFPILSFLDVIFQKEKRMRDFVHNEHRPLYRELVRRARLSDQPSLIKQLDEMKESLNIDEENIVIIGIEMMIGGVDTTSYAMAFSLAVICHHPEWQKKMGDEIDAFVKEHGRMPRYVDRAQLPTVLAVMKETIRYRPSGSLGIPHRATEDIPYKDYIIPKDTVLISNIHTNNSSSNFYKEPEKFIPERYMNDPRSIYASSNANIANRELFTFGWGRRMCPGIYLAETEIFNWLCQLLVKSTIDPIISSDGQKIYPDIEDCMDLGAVVAPIPYRVKLSPRHA
ncbi:cytochrome P450 [Sporodiniella umbellata]|nr:cytochrome P450 [Sporodiniella umbellata]